MFIRLTKCLIAVFMTVLSAGLFPAAPATAHDYTVQGLTIDHPWARPTPGSSKVAAVYLELINNSDEADQLVSVTSDQSTKAEIHETTVVEGIAKMRRIAAGVQVPAKKTVSFKPAGLHVMLLGLSRPLKVGDRIPLTLTFKNRGAVQVKVNIETSPEADAPEHHHHH